MRGQLGRRGCRKPGRCHHHSNECNNKSQGLRRPLKNLKKKIFIIHYPSSHSYHPQIFDTTPDFKHIHVRNFFIIDYQYSISIQSPSLMPHRISCTSAFEKFSSLIINIQMPPLMPPQISWLMSTLDSSSCNSAPPLQAPDHLW